MEKKIPIDENEYCNHKVKLINSSLIGGFISIAVGMVCLESIGKSLKQTFKY